MVIKHYFPDLVVSFYALQDARPNLGVLADFSVLFGRKLAVFSEDGVRYADFTDIVHERTQVQGE